MKVSYAKGLNAAGMILFTVQLLVFLFNYIVYSISALEFFLKNWTCVVGFIVLGAMFVKKKKVTTDFIMTIIGLLLWFVRFMEVFNRNNSEPLISFIICAAGILGSLLILVGLVFEVSAEKKNNNSD